MIFFGRLDARRGWVKQLHLGAQRNNNTRSCAVSARIRVLTPSATGGRPHTLARYLDVLDSENSLPKTIIYNLNPADNYVITMIGNFQDGSVPGKVQFGSGWWFLDQKEGMEWQINALSNLGLLSRFVGMLTDSRSFLSYTRHEYFRRILCNMIDRRGKGRAAVGFRPARPDRARYQLRQRRRVLRASRPESFQRGAGDFSSRRLFRFLPEGLISALDEARGRNPGRFPGMKIKSLLAILVSSALVSSSRWHRQAPPVPRVPGWNWNPGGHHILHRRTSETPRKAAPAVPKMARVILRAFRCHVLDLQHDGQCPNRHQVTTGQTNSSGTATGTPRNPCAIRPGVTSGMLRSDGSTVTSTQQRHDQWH